MAPQGRGHSPLMFRSSRAAEHGRSLGTLSLLTLCVSVAVAVAGLVFDGRVVSPRAVAAAVALQKWFVRLWLLPF
jgi:hypothetical protein